MQSWKAHISRCRLNFQMRRLAHAMMGKKHLLGHDIWIFLRQVFRRPTPDIPSKPLVYGCSGAGRSRYSVSPSVLSALDPDLTP